MIIPSRCLQLATTLLVLPPYIAAADASPKKRANKTATLINKLMNETRDDLLKDELVIFTQQMMLRKVQFTACGFFPLDFTLLHTEVNPHLRGGRGENHLGKPPLVHPSEIRILISPSSAVKFNMTSALANYATEAGAHREPGQLKLLEPKNPPFMPN
uniref:(California timema) hypothetical protein n=1 Tax=Timema californicum TaxID=61474 RepID=A0A7R9JAI1_TIMCA|nr:unnamed protein product [Timema californicum]